MSLLQYIFCLYASRLCLNYHKSYVIISAGKLNRESPAFNDNINNEFNYVSYIIITGT